LKKKTATASGLFLLTQDGCAAAPFMAAAKKIPVKLAAYTKMVYKKQMYWVKKFITLKLL
jgi:hypothetical protein